MLDEIEPVRSGSDPHDTAGRVVRHHAGEAPQIDDRATLDQRLPTGAVTAAPEHVADLAGLHLAQRGGDLRLVRWRDDDARGAQDATTEIDANVGAEVRRTDQLVGPAHGDARSIRPCRELAARDHR